jgi:hypothetical protein
MHAEKGPGTREERGRRCKSRPRVVIFDCSGDATVEVLNLPESARPGDRICHCGRDWLITGCRTGSRVLIAEPVAN